MDSQKLQSFHGNARIGVHQQLLNLSLRHLYLFILCVHKRFSLSIDPYLSEIFVAFQQSNCAHFRRIRFVSLRQGQQLKQQRRL